MYLASLIKKPNLNVKRSSLIIRKTYEILYNQQVNIRPVNEIDI